MTVSDTLDGRLVTKTITQIPLSGPITNIVEYHDCQRFITPSGTYDSLYAIFASYRLSSLPYRYDSLTDSVQAGVPFAIPAATILSYGGAYSPLGIEPGFNCLYLSRGPAGWQARMVPKGPIEPNCLDPLPNPGSEPGTDLDVRPLISSQPGTGPGDYPPVARWDWDSVVHLQYVGITCGDSWCEVGPQGFTSSGSLTYHAPPWPNDPAPDGPVPPLWRARVVEIKGWYDDQYLGIPAPNVGPGPSLVPGTVRGRIFPFPALGRFNNVNVFHHRWVPGAYATLYGTSPDYANKYNFAQGFNRISLCHGDQAGCVPAGEPVATACVSSQEWWAKIEPLPDGPVMYRCFIRRDHGDAFIPATARWRWDEHDETVWMRCLAGCCELQ